MPAGLKADLMDVLLVVQGMSSPFPASWHSLAAIEYYTVRTFPLLQKGPL